MTDHTVLLIDPPWPYKIYSKKGAGRSAEHHYDTMQLEDIKALDMKALMAPDCKVFMWATLPNLFQAKEVGDAWGLRYATCAFTWVKYWPRRRFMAFNDLEDDANWFLGNGYYTRANPELCLLFARGDIHRPVNKGVRNLVIAPTLRHSAKPKVHDRIERLYPNESYGEVFARDVAPGHEHWSYYGNEIDGRLIQDVLREASGQLSLFPELPY